MSSSSSSSEAPFPEWAALQTDDLSLRIDFDADYDWGSRDPRREEDLPNNALTQANRAQVFQYLAFQLSTALLDELHNHLWFIARKESSHIDSLHYHIVKGRSIIVNEEAKMHLVWTSDKVHIKPISPCFLNHHFWKQFLCQQDQTSSHYRALATGFLRSYAYLVRHHSDLVFAHEHNLIPESVDWPSWTLFIAYFRRLPDCRVAKRYHYGQLRLSRLNALVRCAMPQQRDTIWFYEPPYWSTGPYFRGFTMSLGFFLASIVLVLSSMQVELNTGTKTNAKTDTFSGFATVVLASVGFVWFMLLAVPSGFWLWQLYFSVKQREK